MNGRVTRLRLLAAASGLVPLSTMLVLGERQPETVLPMVVASGAAALTVLLVAGHPVAAAGLLFVLASVSDPVIPLPMGRIRLEQPSIVAAFLALLVAGLLPGRPQIRRLWPIVAAFVIYLLVLTVSSIAHAPQLFVSARMIIWTGLSMLAGFVTFALLVRAYPRGADRWFIATGAGHSLLALVIAIAFLLVGPTGIPGMQTSPGEVPKVAGLAFEANLMASMLGAIAPFALDRFRRAPSLSTAAPLVLLIVGLGLGVTRGAYVGLGVAILVYGGLVAYRIRRPSDLVRVMPVLLTAVLLAPTLSAISLPTSRAEAPVARPPGTGWSATPSPTIRPTIRPTPTAQPTPAPTPSPGADTVAYRTNRIPIALRDLQRSPLIGLGAASYGQRHTLAYERSGLPDYIGTLALVALYESGLIGASALALGFLLALWALFRATRDRPGVAAAHSASIVSLLVAYQATNALFFSLIWIILGSALAVAVRVEVAAERSMG